MSTGTIYRPKDIVLAAVLFSEQNQLKKRPVLILDRIKDDYIICPITSNLNKRGVSVDHSENLIKPSIILPYILRTINSKNIDKKIGEISNTKYYRVLIWIFWRILNADLELSRDFKF